MGEGTWKLWELWERKDLGWEYSLVSMARMTMWRRQLKGLFVSRDEGRSGERKDLRNVRVSKWRQKHGKCKSQPSLQSPLTLAFRRFLLARLSFPGFDSLRLRSWLQDLPILSNISQGPSVPSVKSGLWEEQHLPLFRLRPRIPEVMAESSVVWRWGNCCAW